MELRALLLAKRHWEKAEGTMHKTVGLGKVGERNGRLCPAICLLSILYLDEAKGFI